MDKLDRLDRQVVLPDLPRLFGLAGEPTSTSSSLQGYRQVGLSPQAWRSLGEEGQGSLSPRKPESGPIQAASAILEPAGR